MCVSMHGSPFLRGSVETDRSPFIWPLVLSYLALDLMYLSIMETLIPAVIWRVPQVNSFPLAQHLFSPRPYTLITSSAIFHFILLPLWSFPFNLLPWQFHHPSFFAPLHVSLVLYHSFYLWAVTDTLHCFLNVPTAKKWEVICCCPCSLQLREATDRRSLCAIQHAQNSGRTFGGWNLSCLQQCSFAYLFSFQLLFHLLSS